MCNNMSCSQKTQSWPLCIFFGMVKISLINSYVIYSHNALRNKQKPIDRCEIAKRLNFELMKPWLKIHLGLESLPQPLRMSISEILEETPAVPCPSSSGTRKRRICAFCHSRIQRMTRYSCQWCSKAICGDHRGEICRQCNKQIIA